MGSALLWDVLVCLVSHWFLNGPFLLFKLLALRPYLDEYLHGSTLSTYGALELSDWDALKAVYKVLGLVHETRWSGWRVNIFQQGCVS